MSGWEKFPAEAVAVYPYSSTQPLHLMLQSGDRLQITEKCGAWVKAKCKTTSCVGICPLNRIEIESVSPSKDKEEFDLLVFETKCLFKYVFKHKLIPTHHPNESDKKILDTMRKIQDLFQMTSRGFSKINNLETRERIATSLDEIREILDVEKHKRRGDYSVLRTHDITEQTLASSAAIEKLKLKASNFANQGHVSLEYSINYREDLKLTFRIYDFNKKEVISAPADYSHHANTQESKQVDFYNINAESLPNLAIIIRAMSFTQFGEKKNGPWASEYFGIAAEKLLFPKEELSLPFYKRTEGPQSQITYEKILEKDKDNQKELFRIEDFPYINLKYTVKENNDTAVNVSNENEVPTLRIPANVSPSFSINRLNIKFRILHHKTKLKRTRVLLHVLDMTTKQYAECFTHTFEKTCYPTVVQKGLIDMPLDEIAEIVFTARFDINNSYFIYEVERPSRSRGEVHLSSYAIAKITNEDGIITTTQPGKVCSLVLQKPPQPHMEAKDYATIVEALTKVPSGTGGDLDVEIILSSTEISTDPLVHRILHWEKYRENLLSQQYDPKQIDETEFAVFLLKMIDKLIDMISSNDKKLSDFALEFFVQTLSEIDQSRIGPLKYFFDYFIDEYFTVDHPNYVNIFKYLIQYMVDALPDTSSSLSEVVENKCKMCCRCLSYILAVISSSLRLSKEMKSELNEATFQSSVRDIFVRLGKIIQNDDPKITISKSFICRSFPMLCDIISGSFSPEDSVQLVIDFFADVEKDKKSPANMTRLISGIIETQFFAIEGNRVKLYPIIVRNLHEIKTDKFYQEVFPLIKTLFFVLMKSTSAFQSALGPLTVFLDLMVQVCRDPPKDVKFDTSYRHFLLMFIYFCDTSAIGNKILQMDNKLIFFNSMLDLIHIITSSNPPLYIFYICTISFIKMISFSGNSEFNFVHTQIDSLIDLVSGFYNAFLKASGNIHDIDKPFYSHIYITDLEPIAALLPQLLKSVPEENRFNASVILPLFHFYVNQNDPQTRMLVSDGFFLLMQSDWKQKQNFKRSENEAIHALDQVSSNDRMLDLKQLFQNTLPKFGADQDNQLIKNFFKRLDQLTTFMRDIGSFKSEKQYEDERATAILSVLETCKTNNDYMMFPHFTSKLYELHKMMDNKTEAAEVLMECANIFSWNDKELVSEGHDQPEQEKHERKRQIMHLAANLFMESGFYERALEVLGQLQVYYKDTEVDYTELAKIYQKESECFDAICNQERNILNRFYGVKFYGNRFSEYFKDTLFVYRRNGFFMNDQMMRDLKEKFPEANVQPKPPSDEELQNPDLYFIHVFNMKPRDLDSFDPLMPPSELMVKSVCGIDSFYSETPIRKRRDGNYGEFAEWHRHIFRYRTKRPLQGIVRRHQVIETSPLIEMSPIECAVNDTNAKTIELMQKGSMYWRCLRYNLTFNKAAVSSFSMLISGIVNAAVNGGTKVFQELFLESDLKNEPINKEFSKKLKDAFADQLKAVKFALEVHLLVMSDQYMALHQNIVESYEIMKGSMKKVLGEVDLNAQPTFGTIPPIDFFKDLQEQQQPQQQQQQQQQPQQQQQQQPQQQQPQQQPQ